ncbi:MAG: iron-siderophore ABC transporter substrate-binding protein [Caldilinea sp.]|nr:iron-siderophore ABC transporter substrate-binding protein [Caldilinea sp.]MDW8442702.1 iron-siderophore ABC transporter substrate-binding protein [Caldilineaceae bacterium]
MRIRSLFSPLLIAALFLAACASTAAPTAETPVASSQTSATTASVAQETFPVTIEHKFGVTTIPSEPKRVLSLGFNDQDPILAMGVTPIGVRYWFGDQPNGVWPWATSYIQGDPPVLLNMPYGELNYEAIAALQPDLIIGVSAGFTEQEYATLSEIAPTIAQSDAYVNFGVPWQEQTLVIGRALGKEALAKEKVAEMEERFAALRAQYPGFAGKTAVIASLSSDGQFLFSGEQHERMRFLTSLGFVLPPALAEIAGDSFYGAISGERLDLFDVDVLIWTGSAEERRAIEANPVYQSLKVAQEGRVIWLDSSGKDDLAGPALVFSSVLSLPVAFDQLVPRLADILGLEPVSAAGERCKAGFRLFDHALLATDPVCIPDNPQRIIALDVASAELTLMTDKTLLATSGWLLRELPVMLPQFADRLAPVEDVGYPANLEKVLALKPDLILAVGGTGAGETIDVDQALAIAPVVIADPVIYNDWKLGTQFWSEALNVPDLYTKMKANYDARVVELQAALGNPSALKVSVVAASTYGISLWMPDTPPGAILTDVGLSRPEAQSLVGDAAQARYGAGQYISISEERLDLADGDVIFYFTYASADPETTAKETAFIKSLEEKPLWQALKAVKNGRAYFVPGYWWRSQTYLLANKVIDDLFTYLTDTTATTPVLSRQ